MALTFYVTGCYQEPSGVSFDIPESEPAVSCVRRATELINEQLLRQKFRSPQERSRAKLKFNLNHFKIPWGYRCLNVGTGGD